MRVIFVITTVILVGKLEKNLIFSHFQSIFETSIRFYVDNTVASHMSDV